MRYKWQQYVVLFLCLLGIVWSNEGKEDRYFTNSWVLEINGGDEVADRIAKQHDFINMGQVGSLNGVYHFIHSQSPSRSTRSLDTKYTDLINEDEVTFVEQQVELKRVKRDHIIPHDPWWSKQWYLHRDNKDMNVQPAWDQGVTGKGVVVTILDDGLEHSHPDLHNNYDPNASYDFNSHDSDPFPRYDPTNENKHGTRCAGEVAAGLNDVCVVGVAYNASIGGVRMLDGSVTDVVEASSLSFNPQHIDIYSSSWGPTDNGQTVDGPGKLAKRAFINGVTKGRGGKGSIFVWASGNGGHYKDSCNCDGYAVSPYTVSISSVSENGRFPWYAEECSSNLAATYSSGSSGEKQIVSTDLHHGCTDRHTGTSAAAPLAAGMLALALEVRSNLTWRDIQYIIVYSSNPSIPKDGNWITNGVGLKVSLRYGFGILDGAALVNRARHWINVPQQFNCSIIVTLSGNKKASHSSPLRLSFDITKQNCSSINYLEHVQAITTLSVNSGKRGGLHISLRSPQGTVSKLLKPRRNDNDKTGFKKWPFMTVMSWGESPHGQWLFTVSTDSGTSGSLHDLTLVLYGVESEPESVKNIPKTCSSECKGGCSKIGPQYCDICKHFKVQATSQCVSTCPSQTFSNSHKICQNCSKHCANCTNPIECDQCIQGFYKLPSGLCDIECTKSSYYFNGTCLPCHSSCELCNGPTSSNCTQCHDDHRYYLSSGQCIFKTNCHIGQYFDSRVLECRKCHETCAECKGRDKTDCISCTSDHRLKGGKCVNINEICQNGEYFSNDTSSCALCSPECIQCDNAVNCLQCSVGSFLHSKHIGHSLVNKTFCVHSCPNGYYGNEISHICTKCSSVCALCTDFNFCTSCVQTGVDPDNGVCPQPCASHQFYNSVTNGCESCPVNCTSCINSTVCTSCSQNYFLDVFGQCLPQCQNNSVQNPVTGQCEMSTCHETCLTCLGPKINQCLSCSLPRLMYQNTCLDSCPEGHYSTNGYCVECHSSCETCEGPTEGECHSCKSGLFLDYNHCLSSCRSGSFASESGMCSPCSKGCTLCNNSSFCTKCREGLVWSTTSQRCILKCPDNYHDIDGICKPILTSFLLHPLPTTTLLASPIFNNSAITTSVNAWTVYTALFSCLIIMGLVSILVIFLWKRNNITRALKKSRNQYVVLYTHPEELELNEFNINSDSETEIYARTK